MKMKTFVAGALCSLMAVNATAASLSSAASPIDLSVERPRAFPLNGTNHSDRILFLSYRYTSTTPYSPHNRYVVHADIKVCGTRVQRISTGSEDRWYTVGVSMTAMVPPGCTWRSYGMTNSYGGRAYMYGQYLDTD